MLFMISYKTRPENRDKAISRFKETGGPPPQGAEMLGRWHAVSGNRGFVMAQSNDPQAVFKWMYEWSDVIEFDITPVIDDEQFVQALGG